jgi:hypothetical protein
MGFTHLMTKHNLKQNNMVFRHRLYQHHWDPDQQISVDGALPSRERDLIRKNTGREPLKRFSDEDK